MEALWMAGTCVQDLRWIWRYKKGEWPEHRQQKLPRPSNSPNIIGKNSLDMSSSTTSSLMNLSPFEFARVVMNPRLLPHIADSFKTNPLMMAILQHYAFLSDTIDKLNRNLERHQQEQEFTFSILNNNQDFLTLIEPMVKRFRRQPRTRHHPYMRSPSPPQTPSDDNSINPPTTVPSLPETALARLPSSNTSRPVQLLMRYPDPRGTQSQ